MVMVLFHVPWLMPAVFWIVCVAVWRVEGGDDILDFEVLQRINCGTDNEKIQNA
jgi:hypothetical protein